MSEREIQALVDRETAANRQDAEALVALFHPEHGLALATGHPGPTIGLVDLPQGRYDRERWKAGWQELFQTHDLVHNLRKTVRIALSAEGDGAFAVVDVDTLWRKKAGDGLFHWKGRACKGYTKVRGEWLLIFHTGLLDHSA